MSREEKELLEIKEILRKCSNCGFCRSVCPVFKALRREGYSARGRAFMLKNGKIDKDQIFCCTGCRACEIACPNGVKLYDAILKARRILAKKGDNTPSNNEMMKNVRKYGNPFGDRKKGVKDKYYCC
ncbi:(Fe-S)-binding protein [Candidatus Dojkabacteria bacterium]|nr:(Fe-S)-binding protein [Candidatus Dojkabacteria bacterium]